MKSTRLSLLFSCFILATVLFLGTFVSPVSAQQYDNRVNFHSSYSRRIPDNARVILIEDKTVEAGCRILAEEGAGSDDLTVLTQGVECPPMTVLRNRETTYGEVRRLQNPHFVVLTGDSSKDEEAVEKLSQSLRDAANAEIAQPMASPCTVENRTTSVSYGAQAGFTILVRVSYTRSSVCTISNIVDQAKVSGPNAPIVSNCWTVSRVKDQGGTTVEWGRYQRLSLVSYITGSPSITTISKVGSPYAHISNDSAFCNSGPGIWSTAFNFS